MGVFLMKISEIKDLLNATVITGEKNLDIDVNHAFGCDLMSDVLALIEGDVLLLTGLANIQTIRTAEMKDIKCIVFVRDKKPDGQVIELAREKKIILMATEYTMFNSCGILYWNGMQGAEINK